MMGMYVKKEIPGGSRLKSKRDGHRLKWESVEKQVVLLSNDNNFTLTPRVNDSHLDRDYKGHRQECSRQVLDLDVQWTRITLHPFSKTVQNPGHG